MSKGKSTQKTDNSIDPWSRNQFETQQNRIRGLLGTSSPQPAQPTFAQSYSGNMRGVTPTMIGDGRGMGFSELGISAAPQTPDRSRIGFQGDLGSTGLSDYEEQAGGLIDQYIGSYQPGIDQTRAMINDTTFTPGPLTPRSFADFDADVYVYPYADDIISRTSGDIEEAAARARTATGANNLAQGAFGGSRHGVSDALTNEAMLDSIADMSASTRFNTWNQGADRFYQDVGNDMSAQVYNNDQVNQGAAFDLQRAGMLSDLVGQERQFQDQDIGRLMNYGSTERSIQDQVAARQMDNYWRTISAEMGLAGMIPMLVDGETTQTSQPGALGTIGALTGGISDLFNPVDGVWRWWEED